ncbi:MAG: hypothetical protein MUP24_09025 [Gillisia sp.]|nr:hypothetical protein [Gillisia sp.]
MKTLIVFLLVMCGIGIGKAQVIQLEESKVEFAPYTIIATSGLDNYEVVIDENYIGEFSSNALKFVKENFDVNKLIQDINEPGYDSYLVSFRSSKGFLEATYNKDGEMKNSHQMFKDVLLPLEIRREVYTNYKGWTMVKNKYVASGNGDKLNKEIYRINLKKDNKRQNIKIIPSRIGSDRVVSN